jgi:hypothetical protein
MMKKVIGPSLAAIILLASGAEAQTLKKIASIDLPGPRGQRWSTKSSS